ncbi:hypothetical protein F6X40_00620 [Paraburkholderia sp. UCT31]|uniref:hypothetical protein n=1 Tax=Paraburkholderia sp. UCT31 TaxID=2615209 RepID=UPI0016557E5B|nr:hypothetical protein [Paraburkholderia sp. UCT31]MBC8735376.1 hypothetical protein [Paraburkholderia sp. UCT31]
MKTISLYFGKRRFVVIWMASCFFVSTFPKTVFGEQTLLPGGQSIELVRPLAGQMKDRFGDGWSTGFFVDKDGHRLQLFSEEQLTKNGGVVFEGFDQRDVSVTGRYAVLPVVRQGTLEVAGEKPRIEGREYCPVVETATGCILTMQTGEICGGQWAARGDQWLDASVDRTAEMIEKTTFDAKRLWKEFSNSSVHLKLVDVIVANMGISNVMACDPVSNDNHKDYLAIVRQLKNEKATSEAEYIESKLALPAGKSHLTGTKLIVIVDRTWLYDSPHPEEKTKSYIVRGEVVTEVSAVDSGWVQVDYFRSNGRVLRKWIRIDDVRPL